MAGLLYVIFEVPRKPILFFDASQLHTNKKLKLVDFLKEFGFETSAYRKHLQGPDSDAKVFFSHAIWSSSKMQGVFQLLKVQALPHVRFAAVRDSICPARSVYDCATACDDCSDHC